MLTLPAAAALAGGSYYSKVTGSSKRKKRKRREAMIRSQQAEQRAENTLAAMEGRPSQKVAGWTGMPDVFGVQVSPLSLYSEQDPGLKSLEPAMQQTSLMSRQFGVVEPEFYQQVGPLMAQGVNAAYPELGLASGVLSERLTTGMPESLRTEYAQNLRDAQTVRGISGPAAAITEGLGLTALQDQFLLNAIAQAAGLAELRGSLTPMPSPYRLYSQHLPGEQAMEQLAFQANRQRRMAPEWYEAMAMSMLPGLAGGFGQGLGYASGGTTTAASSGASAASSGGGLLNSLGPLPAGAAAFIV